MLFDFSRFLRSVDSRARTVRGLSVGSAAFAALSLTSLAGMLAVRLLRVPFSYWALAAFVVPPLAAAAFGYAVGRSRELRIPHLLLRIDDALGLNARLSSLYELRQRGGHSVFRQRIESEVRDATEGWHAALPVARRTLIGGSAGAFFVALAVGLAFVPLPSVPGSPHDMLEQTSTLSESPHVDASDSQAAPLTEAVAPSTLRTGEEPGQEAGVPSLDAPDRDQTLEDVMRDLAGTSPDEAVLVPISPDEIEQLARQQSEALRAISQLLEAIRDRIENSPEEDASELTEEEIEALQRELERSGLPPEVQEGLNELMNRSQSRSVEEIVEDLIDQLGGDEDSEGGASQEEDTGPPESTAVAPNPQGIEDFLDELERASPDEPGPEGGLPAGPDDASDRGSEGEGTPSSGERSPMIGADGVENPDQLGGSEGAPGLSDEGEERESGFIREEERVKIGTEGSFINEYATEGVPIEWVPGSNGEEPTPRVSYERIASILRERGVPEGAMEIVRDYFNAITEGGS